MEVPGMMSPMPAVLMKMPSALPRSTGVICEEENYVDLRVTRDNRDAGLLGHLAHRVRYPAQVLDEEALLEDHADRDVARYSARHREVVDRAADGQLADIAAVEEQRLHDVRIRREGDLAAHRHGRAIVQFVEVRV